MKNPILAADCPDPCLVRAPDGWLLVSTTYFEDAADKFPLWRSHDLLNWEAAGFVFPRGRTPSWSEGQFWAPEIHQVGREWRCYFTARERTGRLAIGVAFADDPYGPWRDAGAPILRNPHVGVIDSHCFIDTDGRAFLYWKEDGNDLQPPQATPIRVRELASDGIELVGPQAIAIVNDLAWEAHVVEGPWAMRRGEHLYLFYSGNAFHTSDYATGVARARDPLGPYEKLPSPVLVSGERWRGPGHGCVARVRDADVFVHHAWDRDQIFERHPRLAVAARVEWHTEWPKLSLFEDGG